jgi:hypothetical protein
VQFAFKEANPACQCNTMQCYDCECFPTSSLVPDQGGVSRTTSSSPPYYHRASRCILVMGSMGRPRADVN